MAKKETKESFEELRERLNKKYDQGKEDYYFIKTGSLALDKALGGGIATGRITELIAWEGGGKTTLTLHATAEAQKEGKRVAIIDAEHALDKKYAISIGVDWDNLIIFQPMCGEDAFDYAGELLRSGYVDLIIFDSTSGMIPKKQLEDPAGQSHLGLHARLFSAEIPKINSLASMNNAAVIFISQIREKIGIMFGSPLTTQAGNTLKFFASNRIELTRSLNKGGEGGKEVLNQTTKFKTVKCKTNSPFQTGEIDIIFGKGFDKVKEIVNLGTEEGIITKAGSWYSYGEVRIGQGADSVVTFLEDNPELMEEIKSKLC